ncbi:sodium-dependent bicarbonate transport family permease [Gemmatimonas sp.]|uniref:sodium-dependent bicarbonate transport family permease n=1 Tax=Gemmatimonas sp. TaxID=1962908 RepID=UPI00356B48CA
MNEILRVNLLSPIALAFVLGVFARVIRSEFSLPKEIYQGLSIYLLWSLGLHGGAELAHSTFTEIARPAGVTLLIGCITPISAYLTLRYLGRFGEADSAGIAAHYGSVSAVTFIAASTFVKGMGAEPEGFMPTLLTLLESPGIHIALAIGVMRSGQKSRPTSELLHEVLTGRTMVLLVGGLIVGFLIGDKNWKVIEPFYDTKGAIFRGALCIFMLEMGLLAGSRLGDLKKVGPFLLAFGMIMPLVHGALGAWLGSLAGLSVGGATMLGAMAASASYIAAPPAVRMTLPDANPTYYLTLALAITFPFNVLVGIPIYYKLALMAHGVA